MTDFYSPKLPLDLRGTPKVNYPPAKVALASTHKENTSVSSVLVFTHNTTEIEVTTTGLGVAGKWAGIVNNGTSVVATAASTPNFDFTVPAATTRRFVIPQSVASSSASVQGVNRAEGLYQGVAFISLTGGNGSVLTAEF